MYWQFKQKEYLKGILDSGLWMLLISSLVAWVAVKQLAPDLAINAVLKYLTLTFALALVFTQGRHQKNPFLKLGSGIMSLYSLVAYMGDMLSYSRLLALGLATGIIALVINLIAVIFKDMLPSFLGLLVAGIILLIGHLFNLAINVLGSFIHSSRLQFVEFFPKFMEGGGPRFKALKRESKYVELTND